MKQKSLEGIKKFFFISVFFLSILPLLNAATDVQFPKPTGFLQDNAQILTDMEQKEILNFLNQIEKKTSAEVTVVTIRSLNGTTIEDYSNKLFESWKIGKKGKDNGVLMLISIDDKQIRLEIGYGLEGEINDAKAGRIIRNDIAPFFQKNEYGNGIMAGLTSIAAEISPDFALAEQKTKDYNNLDTKIDFFVIFAIIAITILMIIFLSVKNAGIGNIIKLSFYSAITAYWLYTLLQIIGLVLAGVIIILLLIFRDKIPNMPKGGSGFIGGGHGGFGGGGFGGFGGGMSGGGGASGHW